MVEVIHVSAEVSPILLMLIETGLYDKMGLPPVIYIYEDSDEDPPNKIMLNKVLDHILERPFEHNRIPLEEFLGKLSPIALEVGLWDKLKDVVYKVYGEIVADPLD